MTDRTSSKMLMAQAQPGTPPVAPSDTPSTPAVSVVDQVSSQPPPIAEADPASSSLIENMFEFLNLGGPVVMLLVALSFFALTIIFVKMWQ